MLEKHEEGRRWSPWRPRGVVRPCAGVVPRRRARGSRPTRSSSRRVSCRQLAKRWLRRHRGAGRQHDRGRGDRRAGGQAAGKGMAVTPAQARRARRAALQLDARVQRDDGGYDNYRPYWRLTPTSVRDADGAKPRLHALSGATASWRASTRTSSRPRSSAARSTTCRSWRLKVTQERARPARRQPPGRPLLVHPARARVDHGRADRRLAHYVRRQLRQETPRPARRSRRPLAHSANELWFVVVANPDGYDYTFTPGNRLWRKNLRDNNGDGQITNVDGVDPNRNFAARSGTTTTRAPRAIPTSETYRGIGPGLRARDAGHGRAQEAASSSSSRSTTTRPPS